MGVLYIDIWPTWSCLQTVLEVAEEEVMNLPKQLGRLDQTKKIV